MPDTKYPSPNDELANKLKWLPLLVGALLLILNIGIWQMFDLQAKASLRAFIAEEADHMAELVELDLRDRVSALRRLALSWGNRTDYTEEAIVAEATEYLADVEGFQALEWIDRDAILRWVIPLEGNEMVVGKSLLIDRERRLAITQARDTKRVTITNPIELMQGGKGALICSPAYPGGEYDGQFVAVIRYSDWLNSILRAERGIPLLDDYRLAVFYDATQVYEEDGWETLGRYDAESTARILDHRLTVHVRPTEAYLAENASPIAMPITAFVALLSALATVVIWLNQRGYAEGSRSLIARRRLESDLLEHETAEAEIRRSVARTEWAIRSANMGIWTWDIATDRLTWNDIMYRLLDIPEDVDPVYATWRARVHPDDVDQIEAQLQSAVLGKAPLNAEFRYILPDGIVRMMRVTGRVERDANGQAVSVTGLNWDISETKRAEDALRRSEEKVRLLLDSTGEAIYGIDLLGNCTFANQSCIRTLGYPDAKSILGKNMHQMIHYASADGEPIPVESCKIFRAFIEGNPEHVDDEVLWRADGTSFPAEYWSYPQIVNGSVIGAVVTFIDISERKKAEFMIRHLATHDGLTDLPRPKLYGEQLSMAMSLAHRNGTLIAVMYLDLDGFKGVNDSYGHDAGDEVLKEVARRLRQTIRETDTVARMGGDEFTLTITELQRPEDAALIAQKLIDAISRPVAFRDNLLRVGASIGIAVYPRDADSGERLINLADQAMYRIKKAGKNGFGFSGRGDAHDGERDAVASDTA